MHNSFLFLSFIVAGTLVFAQQLPDCGTSCQSSNLGGCQSTDNVCLCRSTTFLSSFNACIQSSCSVIDLAAAIAASNALCLQVGISLSLPGSSTSGSQSTSNSASTTGSPTGSNTTGGGTLSSTKASGTTTSSAGQSGSFTSTPATSVSNNKAPIGAIIGGVVGGLVLVALLIFLWIFRRRRRLQRSEKSPPDLIADYDSSSHIHPTPNPNTATVAGSASGTGTSYPRSWQGNDGAISQDSVSTNLAAAPATRLGQQSGPHREDPRLRDEVEQLRREVQRLQQSAQAGSPSPAAEGQLSVAQMKQLQSQAIRNVYGHFDPVDLPPTYEAAGRSELLIPNVSSA